MRNINTNKRVRFIMVAILVFSGWATLTVDYASAQASIRDTARGENIESPIDCGNDIRAGRRDTTFCDVVKDPCSVENSGGSSNGSLSGSIPTPYNEKFTKAANKFNIPPALLAAIFYAGEHHNKWPNHRGPWASSPAGAKGPFQFMDPTWAAYKVDGDGDGKKDVQNLDDAAHGAAKYLAAIAKDGRVKAKQPYSDDDVRKIASTYNSGNPVAENPETTPYKARVLKAYKEFNGGGSGSATATPPPTTSENPSASSSGDASKVLEDISKKHGLHSSAVQELGGSLLAGYKETADPAAVASTLKVIIAHAVIEKGVPMSRKITVTNNMVYPFGDEPSETQRRVGEQVSVEDAIKASLGPSSNTNANILIEAAGGFEGINKEIRSLGYKNTVVGIYYGGRARGSGDNKTSSKDISAAMSKLYNGSGSGYKVAQKALQNSSQTWGLSSEANKWGATSAVTSNSGVFAVKDKKYIITMYINAGNKGDVIKKATEEILQAVEGGKITGKATFPNGCGNAAAAVSADGYAFPVEPQRRSQNSKVPGMSPLPCPPGNNCHGNRGTGSAFDIGRQPGSDRSAGAKIYAFHSGKVYNIHIYQGTQGCYSFQLKADDGFFYWYGHLGKVDVNEGQSVQAGDVISVIGERKCTGNESDPHLHIDRGCVRNGEPQPGGSPSCRDAKLKEVMNKVFEGLPE